MVKGMKAKWNVTSQQQVADLNSQLKVSKSTINNILKLQVLHSAFNLGCSNQIEQH